MRWLTTVNKRNKIMNSFCECLVRWSRRGHGKRAAVTPSWRLKLLLNGSRPYSLLDCGHDTMDGSRAPAPALHWLTPRNSGLLIFYWSLHANSNIPPTPHFDSTEFYWVRFRWSKSIQYTRFHINVGLFQPGFFILILYEVPLWCPLLLSTIIIF